MKQLLLFAITLILSLPLSAQDETKALKDFNSLSVSTDIKLELISSDKNSMEIDMVRGDRKDLIIEERNGHLKIYTEGNKNWGTNSTKVKIKLYFEELDELNVAAGATVFTDDIIESSSFEAGVSSGASLSMELKANEFESDVSSGGTLRIEGTVSNAEIEASSGGSFKGSDLKCKNGDLGASSGGSISIWVTDSIEAKTSSGGSIKYKGNPANKDIDRDKWSGGSIIAIDNR